MTLDEAIKHAEEVAEKHEIKASWFIGQEGYEDCVECAKEHRQLAEWLKDYKRLLEQQPCEDAISRQALISAFPISDTYTLDDIIATIKFQPPVTPTQRWIPVSERLPEENGGYLVTVNQRYITTALWWGIPKYWDNVIAWMPLPKPYKAEMESEE